jgi:hypothetical protein
VGRLGRRADHYNLADDQADKKREAKDNKGMSD